MYHLNLWDNSDSHLRGRSGSFLSYPRKLWWSEWYLRKESALGNPIGTLHSTAIILLMMILECPPRCVKSWIQQCSVWLSSPPMRYAFKSNSQVDKSLIMLALLLPNSRPAYWVQLLTMRYRWCSIYPIQVAWRFLDVLIESFSDEADEIPTLWCRWNHSLDPILMSNCFR